MNTSDTKTTRLGFSIPMLGVLAVLGGAMLHLQGADEGKGGSKLLPADRVATAPTTGGAHCSMRATEAKKGGCCSMGGEKKAAMDCHAKSADATKDKEADKGHEGHH